ncbi:hypothetical protein GCM10018781_43210 [Kitasatospora indigofera]|uniref:Uncharacterized protein n=1 Tax=Kitasatospora indigofera TaxID=67307 RepID=A0A919KVQ6_9ACTN|nr:hypothetical protein GCM10018781_43210 [Kitasatospora indigofera]
MGADISIFPVLLLVRAQVMGLFPPLRYARRGRGAGSRSPQVEVGVRGSAAQGVPYDAKGRV